MMQYSNPVLVLMLAGSVQLLPLNSGGEVVENGTGTAAYADQSAAERSVGFYRVAEVREATTAMSGVIQGN